MRKMHNEAHEVVVDNTGTTISIGKYQTISTLDIANLGSKEVLIGFNMEGTETGGLTALNGNHTWCLRDVAGLEKIGLRTAVAGETSTVRILVAGYNS